MNDQNWGVAPINIQDQEPILRIDQGEIQIQLPDQPPPTKITTDKIYVPINNFVPPKLFDLPGGSGMGGAYAMPRYGKRGRYNLGITEYPVVTAEEILGGKRKRKR